MKKLDLIEKYLSEELSANERSEFEQLQRSDADFAEEVLVAITINADFNVKQKMRWQGLLNEQVSVVKETPIRKLFLRRSPEINLSIILSLLILNFVKDFSLKYN